MTPEQWAAVVAAVGLPIIIRELITGWRAAKSGRAARERVTNRDLIKDAERAETRRTNAENRADREAHRRRMWEDYAGELRWLLLQCGMPAHRVPDWPDHDADHPPD